jgi:DNA-binding MarR family transcriptional regulator
MEANILRLFDSLRALERQISLLLVDTGLTFSQFRLMRYLVNGEKPSASQLSVRLGITKASVTAQLKELERSGLIALAPNPVDKRSVLVSLTATGKDRMEMTLKNILRLDKSVDETLVEAVAKAAERARSLRR